MNSVLYEGVNTSLLPLLPKTIDRLLDLGCGSGGLGHLIKSQISCDYVGVTYSKQEAEKAATLLDQVIIADLNTFDPLTLGKFDCVICSHVLEHLYWPQDVLTRIRLSLSEQGVLIVALPNVLHWKQRMQFMQGRFRYTDGGLMDQTHFRFYDWQTALDLIESSGFRVISRQAEGNFPQPGIRRLMGNLSQQLDHFAVGRWPGLFGSQFLMVAAPSGDL